MNQGDQSKHHTKTPKTAGVTRLAPSPTGALHLGNVRTFLVNWAMARQKGMKVILRVENLDGPRVKVGADRGAIEILRWLGMDWDEGPYYQRDDLAVYEAAMATLKKKGLVYPCRCTRREIESAQSAPHGDEHELQYPGTCRDKFNHEIDDGEGEFAWRVKVPSSEVVYEDVLCGTQRMDVQSQVGDFVMWTKMGLPAYQLAVVVDDARQGVTEVVRGDDLLRSTARQLFLYRSLGLQSPARWVHLPLVVGEDGRRLAKRHGDTRAAMYRDAGVCAERLVGLMAYWCGITNQRIEMSAGEFADGFDLGKMPREQVVFGAEDHAWLMGE